jgi:co-chaperonin GroES (HSP10)
MIMNLKPLHNKVIVERIEGVKTTSSGIVLQRTEEPDRAKIIAVGPDVDEVSVDDIVLIDWNKAIKSGNYYIVEVNSIVFIYGE